ncbi:MAG: MMPL family transporter [Actinomycetales bacterium]|nr:MMPL family transporter [Actinomycetales bacterium]
MTTTASTPPGALGAGSASTGLLPGPTAPPDPVPSTSLGPPGGRRRRNRPRGSVAAWCVRHRWRTLAGAFLVLVGAVLLMGPGVRTTTDADVLVGDSGLAEQVRSGADFGTPPTENIVITPVSGTLSDAQVARLGTEAKAAYTGLAGVGGVGEPVRSADGRTMIVPIALDATEETAGDVVDPVLRATRALAADHRDLRIGQVGPGSIDSEIGEAVDADFRRAELISLPVTLAVLLIAFGAVLAAGIPVLLGIGAVGTAMGISALVSRTVTPVDESAQSLLLLIGLAVGVDYALFVLRRSREERAAGLPVREAIARAGSTAGRAVVISGITVIVAMTGMLLAGGLYTSLAIGALVVVAIAVVASATVLPAVLSLFGDKVDALRLPGTRRRNARRGAVESGWGRLAGRVTRHPVLWALAAAGLLGALAAPATDLRTALHGAESLPDSFATVEAYNRLTSAFPEDGTTADVIVKAPASARDEVRDALQSAFPAALATGHVVGEEPQLTVSTDGTVTVMPLALPVETSDERLEGIVEDVRDAVVPRVTGSLERVPGAEVHLGGVAANTDLTRWMDDRLPWVVGFVLVLTFLVMLVSFGSLWLAAVTVGLNLLSVGAAYGVLTLVFQNSWAEGLLGFTSVGSVTAWVPMLMFVVLFGLSMDYHVFVVSRVREAWAAGAGPRESVRLGVARSAGVVTSAAVVMVAVFSIFAAMSLLEMKELGVGLATAVLVDATVVRGVLLPAALTLLGRRAHTGPSWIPVFHH